MSTLQEMNIGRTFGAALIFIFALFVMGYLIDPVVWMMIGAPSQDPPGPIMYALFYIIWFLEIFASLLSGVSFYFWGERLVVWRSAYLGIVFVLFLYVFESIENWYQTFMDPNGHVHVGHSSVLDYLILIIGTMLVTSFVYILSVPRTPKGAEMRIF